MAKNDALLKIKELVDDFERNKEYHQSKEFLENHCEEQFVKPFLRALGWDIESRGIAPYLREVITQDRVTSRKTKRAPDYGFRLPGSDTRLFFLEAKGAFVKLKTDKEAAQQARWYGRAGKTPITILFNFAEFAVYDCTQKQSAASDAKFARIKYFTCDEFESNFDFIYDTFSREAIYNGNFQNFIKDKTQKKGNVTLDKDFVESLEKWRLKLAKSIAANNYKITSEELNHAVQLLLDRIIFLRFCEERDVEPFGQLQAVAKPTHIYKHLFDLFYAADQKYNSGLFHFQDGCVTEKLKVDDKTLRDIIEDLYPPKSDYSFYLMPVEILGNAYEQFLGKVIRITAGHNIKIEEKPEVRKAGGVYYTPQYIVDYIVENTVGKLIEGKTPKEIEKIKIVDPACGSGSFLLGAFKYLLNYHQNYYYKKSPNSKELNPDGTLTTVEKRKILTNNIFGVDLDENAVEVSKLSLLLKCMEGETASSVKQQITLHHTRVLPDLDKNIVNGNSLVGFDFTANELALDTDARKALEHKIKPFDWKVAFPQVFKQGGFDAVIGNPPYLKLTANNIEERTLDYYEKKYKSYSGGSSKNLFQLFIERMANFNPKMLSFIVPEALLTTESNGKVREILLQKFNLNSIVIFDHFVFQDATIGTTIFVAEKDTTKKTKIIRITSAQQQIPLQEIKLKANLEPWDVSLDTVSKELFKSVLLSSQLMGDIVEMSKGMVVKDRNDVLLKSPTKKSLPFLLGNCMSRYAYEYDKHAEYDKLEIIGGTRDFTKQTTTPRLLIRRTGNALCATYSNNKELIESTIYILRSDKIDLKFLLGVINSKLLSFYLSKKLVTNSQGFPQILMGQLEQLPIRIINKDNEHLKEEIIKNVDALLNLYKGKKQELEDERTNKKINYHENNIDELVYELYELTSEEIQTIENESH